MSYSSPHPDGTVLASAHMRGASSLQPELVVRLFYFKQAAVHWNREQILNSAGLDIGGESVRAHAVADDSEGRLPPAWPLLGLRKHGGIITRHEHNVLWAVNTVALAFPLPDAITQRGRPLTPFTLNLELDNRAVIVRFAAPGCVRPPFRP